MRLHVIALIIGVSTALFPLQSYIHVIPSAQAQDAVDSAVAQAGATVGQCFVLRGKEKIRIAKGFKLFAGDQIVTSKNSVIEIIYADGSNNVLQENSSISIEEFKTTMNGERLGVKSILNMVRGKARFFFRPRPGGVNATVKTKSSVMGVRGTTFVVDEDENTKETKVAVLTGQVAVKSTEAPESAAVLVKPNQATSIKPNQSPTAPKNLSKEEVEQVARAVPAPVGKSQDGYIPETLELPAPEPEELTSTPESVRNDSAQKSKDSGITAVFIDRRTNRDPLCARYRFDELKRYAQSFDPNAVNIGRQLAKCAAGADEAVYWLAFYHVGLAELNQAANVGRFLTPPQKTQLDSMSEYDQIIFSANNGSPKALKEKVDAKNGLGTDGESLLVLARALVRVGNYKDARTYYARYLKLKMIKADDSEVRVEEIYSYLWASDYPSAEKMFSNILRENINSTARASAERGFLIATNRNFQPGFMKEVLSFSIRSLNMDDVGYNETSGTIEGQVLNDYNVRARYFTLTASQDSEFETNEKSQSADIFVQRRFQKIWGLGFNAGLGYSGVGKGHALYAGSIDGTYTKFDLGWKLGVFGAPLVYRDRAVRADSFDIRDNAVSAQLTYGPYVDYRFTLHMLSTDGSYIENNLSIRVPLLPRVPATDKLNLKLFIQTESHGEKSSVRYYAPQNLAVYGAGIEFDSQVLSWLRLGADGEFGIMSQKIPTEIASEEPDPTNTPFGKRYQEEKGNVLRGKLKATYVGFAQWRPWLSAQFENVNGSNGSKLFSENEAQLGVSYEF